MKEKATTEKVVFIFQILVFFLFFFNLFKIIFFFENSLFPSFVFFFSRVEANIILKKLIILKIILMLCEARENYYPTSNGQLSLLQGDIVAISSKPTFEMWKGTVAGKTGLFPSVQVKELPNPKKPKMTQMKGPVEGLKVKAVHNYFPEKPTHISFTVGMVFDVIEIFSENWWIGEVEGSVGVFPAALVTMESWVKPQKAAAPAAPVPSDLKKGKKDKKDKKKDKKEDKKKSAPDVHSKNSENSGKKYSAGSILPSGVPPPPANLPPPPSNLPVPYHHPSLVLLLLHLPSHPPYPLPSLLPLSPTLPYPPPGSP